MPYYQPRRPSWLEAWQWSPGLNLDGLEERSVTHSHMSNVPRVLAVITRHGKEYFVSPGDYVYRDIDGNWDACPKAHFEGQYTLEDEAKNVADALSAVQGDVQRLRAYAMALRGDLVAVMETEDYTYGDTHMQGTLDEDVTAIAAQPASLVTMTVEQQIMYLASWRHKDLCGVPHIMKAKGPPDHSWLDCPYMARFHWAAQQPGDAAREGATHRKQ